MKFCKKSAVVDAVQYNGPSEFSVLSSACLSSLPDGVEWMVIDDHLVAMYPMIDTPGGAMLVHPGDWVITGVKGERYPCRNDVFEATYELA